DVNSSSTTFVMPSDNVTVKAIFERTPEVRTDDGVSDKGTNITVIAAVAAAAVLFIGAAVYFMFLKKP
ncbi:MAG: hypothetical protein FWG58_02510, partial [Methanomassiliicoccaceae archaeon]|nr:hypothetical protein [Methanomassiliicoccaceae archaeon]